MKVSPNSVTYKLIENTKKTPDKKALVINGSSFSYRELTERVRKMTIFLSENHISKNDLIAFQVNNTADLCSAVFACSALGTAFVPVDPTIPESQADDLLKQLSVQMTIRDEELADLNDDKEINYPELDGDETFIICLTSGSTGKPKPIELTQNIKLKRAEEHLKLYHLDQNDVILASTPLYHSLAERLLIMSVIAGATCVIIEEFKASEWFSIVNKEKVTFTISEASQLSQITPLLLSPFVPDISSLKTVVSSSSLLENHVRKELINKLACNVYEIYGTSESSTLTNINIRENDNKSSVGKVLDFAHIKIKDPDSDGIGDILCRSELMFKGYYHETELSDKAFEEGFFKTGDLGKIDDNGYLYYCGRKDELLKINGIKVYPLNIENAIVEMDDISECAVFSYPDDIKGNVIALTVVKKEGSSLNRDMIREFCKRNLSKIMIPEYIFVVKELPKNGIGKIMKNKIFENIIRYQMTGDELYE